MKNQLLRLNKNVYAKSDYNEYKGLKKPPNKQTYQFRTHNQ